MNDFSIENFISQQIVYFLKRTNNIFTQFYVKNLWESTVVNQPYVKKPMAFIHFWKKRRQLLKKSKQTSRVFLFSVKMVISAAQDRWPLGLSADCIYNHLFKSIPESKRINKKIFQTVLQEGEKNYQRAMIVFFKEIKMCFFNLIPNNRMQDHSVLKKLFFDAALKFLQDPKLQKSAIRIAARKTKSRRIAAHKITDIKKTFYKLAKKDEKGPFDSSFKNVA